MKKLLALAALLLCSWVHAATIVAFGDSIATTSATDAGVIRGVDDLWALLVSKGVIAAGDIDPSLKAKLDARAALRAELKK